MSIIWKPIPGFEERYEVSNTGQVRSLMSRWGQRKQPKILAQRVDGGGYVQVRLYRNDGGHSYPKVHRLVAEIFHGEPPSPLHEVNHKDRVKTNNHESNLEWCTRQENVNHSFKTGVPPRRDTDACKKASANNRELAWKATRRSFTVTDPSGLVHSFHGLNEFCRDNGLCPSKMSSVIRGKRNHHKGWRAA